MSKKHGQRRKRGRKKTKGAACPRCHSPADASPKALLGTLALILNDCASAGIKIHPGHGFVETTAGYVLPGKGGRWHAWVPGRGEVPAPDWGKPDTD